MRAKSKQKLAVSQQIRVVLPLSVLPVKSETPPFPIEEQKNWPSHSRVPQFVYFSNLEASAAFEMKSKLRVNNVVVIAVFPGARAAGQRAREAKPTKTREIRALV